MQEVDFKYISNGVYPAVNVYAGENGVILHDYFQDSEITATKKVLMLINTFIKTMQSHPNLYVYALRHF